MKRFTATAYGVVYEVSNITAIAYCDHCDEAKRQEALLVISKAYGDETGEYVVFGYEMPETDDDFFNIYTDLGAWEPVEDEHKVIATDE